MTPAIADPHEELRRALDRNELLLAYQPIVDLHDGTLGGVEALLRWNHPVRGLLWPGDFLPAVDDAELSARLCSFVIHKAAHNAADWRPRTPGRALIVAVNVSRAQREAIFCSTSCAGPPPGASRRPPPFRGRWSKRHRTASTAQHRASGPLFPPPERGRDTVGVSGVD